MSGSRHLRSGSGPASNERALPDADFVSVGGPAQVYNETAFRYFLAIERERSERSGRPLLLLLVHLASESGHAVRMDRTIARKVFAALSQCVRDTDFTGWYHEDRTAAAVLTQRSRKPALEAAPGVRDRVIRAMSDQLPKTSGSRIQVRLYQLPFGLKGRRTAWR